MGTSAQRRTTIQGSGSQPHADRDLRLPHLEARVGSEGAERERWSDTWPERAGLTLRNTVEIGHDKLRTVRSQIEAESL